jgi:ferredoxin-NADP reductase
VDAGVETGATAQLSDDEEELLVGEPAAFLVVSSKTTIAEGIIELRLTPRPGELLPTWEPGAHIDLVLPSRRVRSYSLCSDPADLSSYVVAALREPQSKGGSIELHDRVQVGDELGYFGPRNHFELVEAPGYLFVAGGIGVTPLLSMIAEAERRGKPWRCCYAGRASSRMAYLEVLAAYGEKVTVMVEDEVGRPDFVALFRDVDHGTQVYCCGPAGMIAAAEATSWRIGTASLHIERFHPIRVPASFHTIGSPFTVRLDRQDVVLEVPEDRSLLSVIRDVVPSYPSSCGSGSCGVCETRVLSGTIEHRDRVLSLQECERGDVMMVCVSRGSDDLLVLDI